MKMKLLTRMLFYILLPAILGLSTLAAVTSYIAQSEFKQANDRQLEELARVQANELDNIMVYVQGILKTAASRIAVVSYLEDADNPFDGMPSEETRQALEQSLQNMIREYGDITTAYVTDNEGIVVAHSAGRSIGSDFSKNDSIQQALRGDLGFESRKGASTGLFNAFLTYPVVSNGKTLGVMCFVVSYHSLHEHTTGALALTENMRAYVYDKEYTVLMDSVTEYIGESDAVYEFVKFFNGKEKGTHQFIFEGSESYAHFARVPSMDWIVVIDTPVAELDAGIDRLIQDIILLASAITIVVGLIIFFVARSIAAVMREGAGIAMHVAAGNLEIPAEQAANMGKTMERGDEIADLAKAIGMMIENIGKMFKESEAATNKANEALAQAEIAQQEANEAAERASRARSEGLIEAGRQLEGVVHIVASASEELSAQIETTSNSVADQANRLTQASAAMEQMNETIVDVARNAVTSAETTDTTKDKAIKGVDITQKCKEAINNVREESLTLRQNMATLAEHAQSINTVMGVITDIADQTNLLALNAAIEAARAGEAGRGFAVVADEVRKLAEKTITSTSDVSQAISAIQLSTEENVKQVDIAVRGIEEATELANQSGEALNDILEMAEQSAGGVRSIATASEEQSATVEEMNSSIEGINAIAHETKSAMDEAAQAIVSLSAQANELTAIVENLKNN